VSQYQEGSWKSGFWCSAGSLGRLPRKPGFCCKEDLANADLESATRLESRRLERLTIYPSPGRWSSPQYWTRFANPLRVVWNFFIIHSNRFAGKSSIYDMLLIPQQTLFSLVVARYSA